jgi:hypothetical protein
MEHEPLNEDELSEEQLQRLGVEEYSEHRRVLIPVVNQANLAPMPPPDEDSVWAVWNEHNQNLDVQGNATVHGTTTVHGNLIVNGNIADNQFASVGGYTAVLETEVDILKTTINTMEQRLAELEIRLQEIENEQDVPQG